MPASSTEICNIALGILDESRITALTDATEAARLCNLHYDAARDFVMRLHPWNFAMRRAVPSQNQTGPAFGYSYSFRLPTDPYCLRVVSLEPVDNPPKWKVEGRDLLCDESAVSLVYVGRILDVASYDAGFVQALSHYLAWKLAKPLTGSRAEAADKREEFLRVVRMARGVDGMEDVADAMPTSPFVLEHLS